MADDEKQNDAGQNPDGPAGELTNAGVRIDRLGGIRAVSTRIGVPVVVVQGWKRNDSVPAEYRDAFLLIESQPPGEFATAMDDATGRPPTTFQMPTLKSNAAPAETLQAIRTAESRAIQKSALITIVLMAATAGIAAFLLWPERQDLMRNDRRVAQLQQQTEELQRSTQAVQQSLPDQIRNGVEKFSTVVNGSANQVANATGLEDRVQKLEAQVAALASPAALQAMLTHVANFQQTTDGQQLVANAVHALAGAAGNSNDDLSHVAQTDPAARQVLSGVAPEDVQAAVLLLGLSHLRFALGRDDVPFDDDVALLERTLGHQDPALDTALNRLEPIAASGVLTPEETAAHFTAKLGASIIASQSNNPNASMQDRALAQLGSAVQVHKDGALVGGDDVQAAVDRAQTDLSHGDLAGAASTLHGLQGPAAATAAPWLQEADSTLLAQQVATMVAQRVSAQLGSNGLSLTTVGALPTSASGVMGAITPTPLVMGAGTSVVEPASAPASPAPTSVPASAPAPAK